MYYFHVWDRWHHFRYLCSWTWTMGGPHARWFEGVRPEDSWISFN